MFITIAPLLDTHDQPAASPTGVEDDRTMTPELGGLKVAAGKEPRFVSGGSSRPASQEAQGEAKIVAIRDRVPGSAGRSLPTHPIVLRDVPARPDAPPKQRQLNQLHRALNQRDLVILQALYDYRYLNTFQIQQLFFPSLRSCQMRLQSLQDLGVIYRWKVIETPGVRRRHSLVLISTLGARVLAGRHRSDVRTYLERARDARDHCWHALHDLEANQFFVSLAVDGRGRQEEGLLVWTGEDKARSYYRRQAREYRWPAPAPDGMGTYLASGGEIDFDFEWDRATESVERLRQKIASYVGFWKHFRDAEDHHVLVVAPTDDREERIRRAIWRERPRYVRLDHCCRFWTTTAWRIRQFGPAAAIWLAVDIRAEEAPGPEEVALRLRAALARMAPTHSSGTAVEECIGKPEWWLRRPGGGQIR